MFSIFIFYNSTYIEGLPYRRSWIIIFTEMSLSECDSGTECENITAGSLSLCA